MSVQVNALEARIIGILKDWYPITVEELQDELSLRKDVLEKALKSLVLKGIVSLEPLSDKTYVRLLVPEVVLSVTGRKRKGKKLPPPHRLDEDSIMYR